ncbi:hypothetical protein Nepgr_023922 [Nepenthes gracilis]|uniref:Uncharacterized protein n=1 Tax=Nepenthes gracilis TaxID=150966 RepID=A0AAD3XZJ8_NEPGR|nr:hypothetical protein Nepgr_023922 [Nepenthes gracilis]
MCGSLQCLSSNAFSDDWAALLIWLAVGSVLAGSAVAINFESCSGLGPALFAAAVVQLPMCLLELMGQCLAGAAGMLFWLLWHGFVGIQLLVGWSPCDDVAYAGLVRRDTFAGAAHLALWLMVVG